MRILVVLATILAGVFGAAIVQNEVRTTGVQTGKYDDLTPGPVVILNTLPDPYQGLTYTNLIVQGPFFRVTGQVSSISVGGGKTFDLLDLYYGCITATYQEEIQVSIACTFIITGYKNGGNTKVGPQSFHFDPDDLFEASMQQSAFLPAFKGLNKVVVDLVLLSTTDVNTVILLDDIRYKING